MSVAEAARVLGVSRQAVYDMVDRGALRARMVKVRIVREVRVRRVLRADVEKVKRDRKLRRR